MEGYRIRRGASLRTVADTDALVALAVGGQLHGTDEVETPEGWVRAAAHPALRGRFGADDPWAAWSDVESVDADTLYKRMVDEPAELPLEAYFPVPPEIAPLPDEEEPDTDETPLPGVRTLDPALLAPLEPDGDGADPGAVAALEPDAVVPLDADAVVPRVEVPGTRAAARLRGTGSDPRAAKRPDGDPLAAAGHASRGPQRSPAAPLPLPVERPERPRAPLEEAGELIAFPGRPPPPPDFSPARRARQDPPPLVRTSRLVTLVLGGMFVLLLGYGWIRMNAFSRAGVSTPRPARERPVATQPSALALLDAELRASLAANPRQIRAPEDLSNALLVELVQQRVQVEAADGLVTRWVGKKGDEPRTAEVRIRYRSGGDMARELGAIALVGGRYKRLYRLEMPVFEVTELGTNGVTTIDPEKAEAYYQARLSLEELLGSIAGKR